MNEDKSLITVESLLNRKEIKQRFTEIMGEKAPLFISSILSAVNTNPQLKQCEPMSVVASAAIAASLDLPINSNLGFAYLVPYYIKGILKAQFQVGYRGFIQLAIRTGQYKIINASVVYEDELVRNDRITGDMEFDYSKKKSDKAMGYVAYFKLLNGFEKYYYMTAEEIEKHAKRYSQAYQKRGDSLWHTQKDVMALKTVLKLALSKYGILSIEMEKAITYDQAVIKEDNTPEYPDNPQYQEEKIKLEDVIPEEPKEIKKPEPIQEPPDIEYEVDTEVEIPQENKPKTITQLQKDTVNSVLSKIQKYDTFYNSFKLHELCDSFFKQNYDDNLLKEQADKLISYLFKVLKEKSQKK